MKLFFFIVCASVGVAIGIFLWDYSVAPNNEHEQVEPKQRYRVEDHLTFIEFELDDGTPCVMVAAPGVRTGLSGSVPGKGGVSCDWDYNRRQTQ